MSETVAPQASDRITLAGSDVSVPPLGVGTWAWGDKSTWGMGGYDSALTESTIREAWEASIDAGVVLFDTAEVYGGGESERIIGRLLAKDPAARQRVVIATKFMPSPWKVNVHSALLGAARQSRERLGVDAIDLYQIHGPISLRSHDAIADALAGAHAEGVVKAVGRVELFGQGDARDRCRAAQARPAAGQQSDRVLSVAGDAPSSRVDRRVPGARRRAAGVLADRAGPPDGKVQRRQATSGETDILRPPDGADRRYRGRTTGDRRCPRAAARRARWPWPGSSPRGQCPSRGPKTARRRSRTRAHSGGR